MWRSPEYYQQYISKQDFVVDLYDAMAKDDLAEPVLVALDILNKTQHMDEITKVRKCHFRSRTYRQKGNDAYKASKYEVALEYYNKALMFAPKGSEEMVIAYSNRSAVAATCNMHQACLNDINTCFALGCPPMIADKLKRRKYETISKVCVANRAGRRVIPFAEDFFSFPVRRNPQIPCASIDIGVFMESQIPKIVAIRDVKVGKLIAVEQAFVTQLDRKLQYSACYYCHKINLNLIPCDNCCSVLFCNRTCMHKCVDDYHGIECQVIDEFDDVGPVSVSKLSINTALKFRNQFPTWELFNEATQSYGLLRLKASGINEIYDVNNIFSVLTFKDDIPFKYGNVYNASFCCATVIHYLGLVNSFFPSNEPEKAEAIRGFSRLLMYVSGSITHTDISSPTFSTVERRVDYCDVKNYGMFPFIGKLKGACIPNVLALGLNNEIALVTVQPLKPGDEITVACFGHWLDNKVVNFPRWKSMYCLLNMAYVCPLCSGDWELLRQNSRLSEAQQRWVRKLDAKNAFENYSSSDVERLYLRSCKTLAFLADVPFSIEYSDVYKLFRWCLTNVQDKYTRNIILDCSMEEIE